MIHDLAQLSREEWAVLQLLIVTAVVMWVAGVRAALRESEKVHSTMNEGGDDE